MLNPTKNKIFGVRLCEPRGNRGSSNYPVIHGSQSLPQGYTATPFQG